MNYEKHLSVIVTVLTIVTSMTLENFIQFEKLIKTPNATPQIELTIRPNIGDKSCKVNYLT